MQTTRQWRSPRVGWALALDRPTLDEPELRVDSMMSRHVMTCRATDSVNVPAQIMWEHDCGCVPVVDDASRVISMITDRDICMATLMQGKKPTEIMVGSACSRRIFLCHSGLPVGTAVEIMARAQVRRLPVVDADGRLVGIIALSDLIRNATLARLRAGNAEGARTLDSLLVAVSRPRRSRGDALALMTNDEREGLAMFNLP